MKKIFLLLSIAILLIFFITVLLLHFNSFGMPKELKIDFLGGYQFGMNLEEADSVREDDKITGCTYLYTYKCLRRETMMYDEKVIIDAKIGMTSHRLNSIAVNFERLKMGDCIKLRNKIFNVLITKYGIPSQIPSYKQTIWDFPRNDLQVELFSICIINSTFIGHISIHYANNEALEEIKKDEEKRKTSIY